MLSMPSLSHSHSLIYANHKLMTPLQMNRTLEYKKWPTEIDLEYTPQK